MLALASGSICAVAMIAVLKLHAQAQAAPEALAVPAVEAFRLQASGEAATGCTVEKTAAAGPRNHVIIAQACDDVLPGLSKMRFWLEAADGTVTLSEDGKRASVVFALADGVAYESVEPRMPLMSLIASNELLN